MYFRCGASSQTLISGRHDKANSTISIPRIDISLADRPAGTVQIHFLVPYEALHAVFKLERYLLVSTIGTEQRP